MIQFCYQGLFSELMILKIGIKLNFRIKTKFHVNDPEIRILKKIDFTAVLNHESMTTAGTTEGLMTFT